MIVGRCTACLIVAVLCGVVEVTLSRVRNSQTRGTLRSSAESRRASPGARKAAAGTAKNKNKKSCRFKWEWETLIYGDICLPAKSTMLDRRKSTAISRHKHRHRDREYKDNPKTLTRHLTIQKKESEGEALALGLLGPSGGGLHYERPPLYQMDSPPKIHSVSGHFMLY